MTGGTLIAVLAGSFVVHVAAVAAAVWLARRAAGHSTPTPTPEDLDRLWGDLQATAGPGAPSVPRQRSRIQMLRAGEPLSSDDIDRFIASLQPCGSILPTCRLHRPATCRAAGPCCPTCPTTTTSQETQP